AVSRARKGMRSGSRPRSCRGYFRMAYRVLIAQFMHETNTFSKLKTTLDDYRRRWLIDGEEMVPRFKGTRNEGGGQRDTVGHAHEGNLGDDPRQDHRCGSHSRQARCRLPVAARRDGDRDRG